MRPVLIWPLLLTLASKAQSSCEFYQKCGECMSDPECQWCPDLDFSGVHRCLSSSQINQCKSPVNVQNDVKIVINNNLENSVLIKPQKVDLNLRPGISQEIEFEIAQSKDYPVDLYFLFDLSFSMKSSVETLAEQGGAIIKSISEITKDVQIGFGSFIDKDLAPFAKYHAPDTCPEGLYSDGRCNLPYAFHHRISLAPIQNEEEFEKLVKDAPLGGNVDNPEGGLDGLLQTMLCKERIGWRNSSRKIILLATDRDYHNALDGKLVGILHPNDGQCHLDESGYYSKSKEFDYPSISQINFIAQQVKIFFLICLYD